MGTPHLRIASGDRRQQILEAATELFAKQGFEGTTTRQIAEKAKVNEAIIFRHFPSKEELYWEVIKHKCDMENGIARMRQLLGVERSQQEIFAAIAEDFLRRREADPGLSRLLLFSALESHSLSSRFYQTHIAAYYEALTEYIRQQIAAGKFRRVDPMLAARGFLGLIVYHSLIQDLFGGKKYQTFDVSEVSQTLAELWLKGMLPRGAEAADLAE
jgi:AcrR family transcriptional regulator